MFLKAIEDTGSARGCANQNRRCVLFHSLFHTFGLALLVGANAVVDLRLLGVARAIPLAPLKRLFRIMWIGSR